jgi:hypothetical protein
MLRNRILSALVLFIAIAFAQSALAQSSNGPKYSGDKLIFPDGFRTSWLFVGSNIGLQYKGEGRTGIAAAHANAPGPQNAFHNVYITQDGYAGFLTAKTAFPDRTMFVVDIYSAKNKEPHNILAKGSFDGDQEGALVAVKDSTHPQGSGPDKTIWSYYVFGAADIAKPGATAAPADSSCAACHKKNGLVDNVWVQFYPVLLDAAKPTTK